MLVEMKKINKKEIVIVTSRDVAETFEKEHYHVMEDIREIQSKISTPEFSGLFYEGEYKASNGKKNPMYYMNRDGFTLLAMGYTGEKAMRFKLAYIKQFNAMEELLKGKMIEREKGIAVRQSLTKAIQQSNENDRMHGYAYSLYTDLIYKVVFGKNTKQLRAEYGITKKDNLRDLFSQEELAKVEAVERLVSGLVDCGWGYDEVKEFVLNDSRKLLVA